MSDRRCRPFWADSRDPPPQGTGAVQSVRAHDGDLGDGHAGSDDAEVGRVRLDPRRPGCSVLTRAVLPRPRSALRRHRYPDSGRDFVDYGRAFQQRFLSDCDYRLVVQLERLTASFRATLEDRATIKADRVVVAAGFRCFAGRPPKLGGLPASLVSHSAYLHDGTNIAGSTVAAVGGGRSAVDSAALLADCGFNVTLINRGIAPRFQTPLGVRPWHRRLLSPMTAVEPGWKSLLCTKAPFLCRLMPAAFRLYVKRRFLDLAPGGFARYRIEGRIPVISQARVSGAAVEGDQGALSLSLAGAPDRIMRFDHVVAPTGYRVNLRLLAFFQNLIPGIQYIDGSPILSSRFKSTVPGLYFMGCAEAASFGPMLRFVSGTDFASRRLCHRLMRGAMHDRRSATASLRPRAASVFGRGTGSGQPGRAGQGSAEDLATDTWVGARS